ncbi:hypothetical protein NZK35_20040 [Stieleria sp. ICT_E10.1]|uniref:hypothetical protein n=1 Tax=Stieleria sedimenti TaxID=2976331 RepID=UPI00217FCC38|nr:hypothetical protein [Stieleria sedimenti]MCS7468950.1 hypothetical protein [Stieleria sedimenti]
MARVRNLSPRDRRLPADYDQRLIAPPWRIAAFKTAKPSPEGGTDNSPPIREI